MIEYRKANKKDILFLFKCHSEKAIAERASLIQENIYHTFYKDYLAIINNNAFHVYIIEVDNDKLGFIKLHETNKQKKETEGSIWIGKKRRHGYGLNAFYLLLYIAFETLKYRIVWGWVRGNNKPMHNMLKKFDIRVTETSMMPAWKINDNNHLERIFYYEINIREYIMKKKIIIQDGLISMQEQTDIIKR